MSVLSEALRARAAQVQLVGLDVDGVLTDGRLIYGPDGEALKTFHVRDGLGIRMLGDLGVFVAVVTARKSQALSARIQDLRIPHFRPGCEDKLCAFSELAQQLGLELSQCAFMGDDLIDLPVMRAVGLAVTVADGHGLVRAEAHHVTSARGGEGAVRELTDLLLECRLGLAKASEAFLAKLAAKKPSGGLQ